MKIAGKVRSIPEKKEMTYQEAIDAGWEMTGEGIWWPPQPETVTEKLSFAMFKKKAAENLALDGGGNLTYLAPSQVNLTLTMERWPDIEFRATREH